MKNILVGIVLLLLVCCSSEEKTDSEQSVIDQAVQKTADKAVKHIQDPIDKAEAVKVIGEERTSKIEEQVQ